MEGFPLRSNFRNSKAAGASLGVRERLKTDAMFMAVTKNGSCHVVKGASEGAVKEAAHLRKMPHKMAISAP
jgi:hypothetical protein